MHKALFLDRDGVLNKSAPPHEYISRVEDFHWIPGAMGLIAFAKESGFIVCVITNQQGIGKGLYSLEDVEKIHRKMQEDLKKLNAGIDGFYICPHLSGDGCSCRKPQPGLLKMAMKDFDITDALFVGDSDTDVEAGIAAGVDTFKIETDKIFLYEDSIKHMLSNK